MSRFASIAVDLANSIKRLIYGVPSDFVPSDAPLSHEKAVVLMNSIYKEYKENVQKKHFKLWREQRTFEYIKAEVIDELILKYDLGAFVEPFKLFITQMKNLEDSKKEYENKSIINTYGLPLSYEEPIVNYPLEIANHINQDILATQAETLKKLRESPKDITLAVKSFLTPEERSTLTLVLGRHGGKRTRRKRFK